MPKSIEAQGVTVDEAIQTALNLLGLGRDSVEIEIIHHPRSGFLGIGARRAKVRATMREQVMKDGEEFDMAPDAGSRGRRRRRSSRRRTPRAAGEQRPREQKPASADAAGRRAGQETRAAAPAIPAQKQGAGDGEAGPSERRSGEQRGRGRGRRGGRGRGGADRRMQDDLGQSVPNGATPSEAAGTQAEKDAPGNGRPGGGRSRAREQVARLEPEALRSRAQELTSQLLVQMGVEASVSARVEEGGSIAVTIDTGEDGAILIGRRGTTLDALEHIINRMTTGTDPGARVRVALDVCGYRERRKANLGEVAGRLKQHALSTMKRVQITPLSPHDRVVFQEALAGDDSVTTRIVGSGFYRRVLVIPRGHESDGGMAEEFSEEGHLLGYPAPGGAEEDGSDEPSEELSPDAAGESPLDSDEPTVEDSKDPAKLRGEE